MGSSAGGTGGAFDDVGGAGMARSEVSEDSEKAVGEADMSKIGGKDKCKCMERDGAREESWESWKGRCW